MAAVGETAGGEAAGSEATGGEAAAPQRILVVDDCIHEGSTAILTLGLLDWVYPQADVRYLNANAWYHGDYGRFLLDTLLPVNGDDAKIEAGLKIQARLNELKPHLTAVAIGSEDCEADSLLWQPVGLDSPALQALSEFLPPAEWLRLSQAVYPALGAEIARRAPEYRPAPPQAQDSAFGLRPAWEIMRRLWLEGGLTRGQILQGSGQPVQEIERLLGWWRDYPLVTLRGRGRGARYAIAEPLRRRMEGLEPYSEQPLDCYWLLPGRLMFGDTIYYHEAQEVGPWQRQQIGVLLDAGIDRWIDVQIPPVDQPGRANPLLAQEAQAIGREAAAEVIAFDILYVGSDGFIHTRRGRPNRKDIRRVLNRIDQLLSEGRTVYVSASSDSLRGILAGCYLARHGQPGGAALEALQACRAGLPNGWIPEPVTRLARRYVRNWREG